jgi:hypothetical protein
MISICTPTLKHSSSCVGAGCFEYVYSNKFGVGAARKDLVERSGGNLIIMLDDDIIFSSKLLCFLSDIHFGEFAMAVVDGHVSTRVFAINRYDYDKTSGFDSSIKYVFEDGAFFIDAINHGLKFKVVPSNLFSHKEHVNRTGDKRKFASWWEHSRMLVKYKNYVYPGLIGFFGLRSILKQPHIFLVKTVGTIYWILRRKN